MEVATTISIVALVTSGASLYITYRQRRKAASDMSYISNASKLTDLASDIGNLPDVLRFYGISKEELNSAGIDQAEFAYLYRNFLVGSIFHLTKAENNTTPFLASSYRYKMLQQESTREAWQLIKRIIATSSYTKRVDNTIKEIEKAANK